MSFVSGTYTDVLFSMPGPGATKTTTTQSLVSGNSATSPAFLMPALGTIWPASQLQGKALQILMGGTYDAGAVTNALTLSVDATQGTHGTDIAATGAFTIVSTTTGAWSAQVLLTCIGTGAVTSSNWEVIGGASYGAANNASTTGTNDVLMGGANSAGVPTAVTLSNTASNFWEVWSTFGTAPTAFVMSQFVVMALN